VTSAEALDFLRLHQPMPSDHSITAEVADGFIEVLKCLETQPIAEAIPLLIGTVTEETGLGMYEHIKFVLMRFPADVVAPFLIAALEHQNPGRRYRAAWWACDSPSKVLIEPLRSLISKETDEDIIFAATTALEVCEETAL